MDLLETFITFTRNMDAVEKTLRLLQASFSAATFLAPLSYRHRAVQAKSHIIHSRRFFRVFMWLECWSIAARSHGLGALHEMLLKLGYGSLGMYLFLDMLLLPFALGAIDEGYCNVGIYQLTGSEGVDVKAIEQASFVCWFYSTLLFAIILVLESLTSTWVAMNWRQKMNDGQRSVKDSMRPVPAKKPESFQSGSSIVQRMLWSICDILVSGAAARRIIIHPLCVAIAMAMSSLLGMQEIWVATHTDRLRPKVKQGKRV